MSESKLGKELQLRWTMVGDRLFRNNVGKGWVGKSMHFTQRQTVEVYPGSVVIHQARPLNAGLCVGSGDYIGFKRVVITPEMVGQTIAQFVSMETKFSSRPTEEQKNFCEMVKKAGGIAKIVRNIDDSFT